MNNIHVINLFLLRINMFGHLHKQKSKLLCVCAKEEGMPKVWKLLHDHPCVTYGWIFMVFQKNVTQFQSNEQVQWSWPFFN
jgi:hypothetical protein